MKIAILTLPLHTNYGGILQAYALQTVLERMGHEVTHLQPKVEYFRLHNPVLMPLVWCKRLYRKYFQGDRELSVFENPYKWARKNTDRFISENLNCRFLAPEEWNEDLANEYDTFIVGSDQVWRPAFNLGSRLGNMFLNFADDKVKKLSYAASFGCKEWEYTKEQEKTCSRLATRFDAISVREASAVDLCKNHFGVDASLVLDPTLLLNKEEYEKVCNDIPKKEKHIFVYSLVVGESVMNVASKVSEAKGLPIVVKEAGGKVKKEDTIEDWFAEFRDAEYVVTDSFHGMVFSIIFNKPFSIVMNPSGGNDRYISLLSQLGLTECIVDEKLTPSSAIIDWEQVCSRLNVLRESSLLFLKQNLR